MPSMSSANRAQLAMLLEGVYPTNFGVTPAGNGKRLNMVSESLNFDVKTQSSKSLRDDRQVPSISIVSANTNGGFEFELQYGEYDDLIEATLQGDWLTYGVNGLSSTIVTAALTATTLTANAAPGGASDFTTLPKGTWFTVVPGAAETTAVKKYFAGRAFRLSSTVNPTGTVLTVDASTPFDTNVAASLANCKIRTSQVTHGNKMRTYSLEVGHGDISGGVFRLYQGMSPSKMGLNLSVGDIVTGSFEFIGKSMELKTATSMGTPAASSTATPPNATKGVFDIFENGAKLSALTYIRSGEFSVDNMLRGQEALSVYGFAGVGVGTMSIVGKLEVYFSELSMYQRFVDGAASSLSIPILDVDGTGYVFYFPKITYTAGKVNATGQDQDNMLSLDFQATPDPVAASATFGKSLVIYRV